jgi:exonuclease III
MKILTWNLQRPKASNQDILDKLAELDADILILTETNSAINPGGEYSFVSTKPLEKGFDGIDYKFGEKRTMIWSKFQFKTENNTYDGFTSVCVKVKTEFGLLKVYGTIIGVFGGIGERFKSDLKNQIEDFENFSLGNHFCIAGDLNVTFSGRVYPSHDARNKLNSIFQKLDVQNLTGELENNVDHIVLSKKFLYNKTWKTDVWNEDKKLSDHIGICVSIK